MKKYLFLMLAIIGMAVSFTACSSDDGGETTILDSKLIGTWETKLEKESWNSTIWTSSEITFNSDRTVIGKEYNVTIDVDINHGDVWPNYTDTYKGEWKQLGENKIQIDWKNGERYVTAQGTKPIKDAAEEVIIVYKISSDGKTLTYKLADDEPEDVPEVFTRK